MINSIKILKTEILSDHWYKLRRISFEYKTADGRLETQDREVFDRGNGAAILLYHPLNKTVILTRQFRMPTFLNGSADGMMIETCAGLLDGDNPEDCIRRETEEEAGYKISNVRKVFETYMSPGVLTEILHLFVAEYESGMKVSEGGGLEHEQENIEVLEIEFAKALEMMKTGEICDAKTIILLQYAWIHGLMD